MILATVGTHDVGFDRLITAVDDLAANWNEEIIIQRGSSLIEPRHATHFQWTSSERMEQLTRDARVLITHAAAGAIILGLCKQKPLILVPRLKQYGEHMDDHQQQLATALAAQGRAISVTFPSAVNLRFALAAIAPIHHSAQNNQKLVGALQQQLAAWA